jgi:hypothetical protein
VLPCGLCEVKQLVSQGVTAYGLVGRRKADPSLRPAPAKLRRETKKARDSVRDDNSRLDICYVGSQEFTRWGKCSGWHALPGVRP